MSQNDVFIGTYGDRISYNGYVLSDHMLLGTVVATILILDNTAQVSNFMSLNSTHTYIK